MTTQSINIGTTSTYKDDYSVSMSYKVEDGLYVLQGASSYHGREIDQFKGRKFKSLDELVKFCKQYLKNILD